MVEGTWPAQWDMALMQTRWLWAARSLSPAQGDNTVASLHPLVCRENRQTHSIGEGCHSSLSFSRV